MQTQFLDKQLIDLKMSYGDRMLVISNKSGHIVLPRVKLYSVLVFIIRILKRVTIKQK